MVSRIRSADRLNSLCIRWIVGHPLFDSGVSLLRNQSVWSAFKLRLGRKRMRSGDTLTVAGLLSISVNRRAAEDCFLWILEWEPEPIEIFETIGSTQLGGVVWSHQLFATDVNPFSMIEQYLGGCPVCPTIHTERICGTFDSVMQLTSCALSPWWVCCHSDGDFLMSFVFHTSTLIRETPALCSLKTTIGTCWMAWCNFQSVFQVTRVSV